MKGTVTARWLGVEGVWACIQRDSMRERRFQDDGMFCLLTVV